ncbi:gamma-glutamylcyclotransferase [Actibacterium sp. 188UL27-1]|uniref:gamma-glutamylcyclotransferase n=1 Tax=Actibacterium sp. 188UL27-1 TaxID=2786961 RepID=UPI0019569429|nr:gamma-glutamylcyclotransferase [Actibacterium sp. 188UL27-1]MBM7066081.1 gamma-glutamylcyclotransferase [Actibacterium sp. 188UL27-1]
MTAPENLCPLWVFGYGSLIWNPGFPVAEQAIAMLSGYRRGFCMSSIHHRGSVEAPGLVLALDILAGASCHGVAFKVAEGAEADTLATLRERELISSAYYEAVIPLDLADGRATQALAYVVDQTHDQYRGDMDLERQAQIIAGAQGGRGPNTEYLWNTVDHLRELGIQDPELEWLDGRVRALKRP